MNHLTRLVVVGGVLIFAVAAPPLQAQTGPDAKGEKAPTAEQIAFFEKSIRPILVRECYSCHSKTSEKLRGGLLLDTREGLRKGGDTGPALVPGDPKSCLFLKALWHAEVELKMLPKKKLSDDIFADFE